MASAEVAGSTTTLRSVLGKRRCCCRPASQTKMVPLTSARRSNPALTAASICGSTPGSMMRSAANRSGKPPGAAVSAELPSWAAARASTPRRRGVGVGGDGVGVAEANDAVGGARERDLGAGQLDLANLDAEAQQRQRIDGEAGRGNVGDDRVGAVAHVDVVDAHDEAENRVDVDDGARDGDRVVGAETALEGAGDAIANETDLGRAGQHQHRRRQPPRPPERPAAPLRPAREPDPRRPGRALPQWGDWQGPRETVLDACSLVRPSPADRPGSVRRRLPVFALTFHSRIVGQGEIFYALRWRRRCV